jgi:hypothetical protein
MQGDHHIDLFRHIGFDVALREIQVRHASLPGHLGAQLHQFRPFFDPG